MARIASLLAAAAILIAFMAGAFTFTWWLAIAALALLALAVLDEIGPRAWVYAHRGYRGAHVMLLMAGVINTASAIMLGFAIGHTLAWLWLA
jgi:hypothetical protein